MYKLNTRKRGKKWEVYFELPRKNGYRQQYSKCGFNTEREALEHGRQMVASFKDYNIVEDNPFYFDYLDKWVETYPSIGNDSTYTHYKKLIKNQIKGESQRNPNRTSNLKGLRIKQLKRDDLQELLNARFKEGISLNTLDNVRAILTASLSTAEYNNLIFRSPANGLKLPNEQGSDDDILFADEEGEEKIIGKEDLEKIFNHFDENTYDFIPLFLLYRLGLRKSEALGLTWNAFDFENSTLLLRRQVLWSENDHNYKISKLKHDKKGLGRDIHIDKNTLEILRRLQARKNNDKDLNNRFHHYYSDRGIVTQIKTSRELDFVCVDKYGERLTNNSLERIAEIIREELGVGDFKFHKLRHTHASELYEKGMREKYIGERLGHKNFKITDIYIHPTLESKQSSDKIVESLFETE